MDRSDTLRHLPQRIEARRLLAHCVLLWCVIGAQRAFGQSEGPSATPAPAFHARDLLPADQLTGRDYRIDDQVPLADDRYLFTLRTSDGPVTAHGLGMLQVRLDEVRALEKARELDAQPQVVEGMKDSVKATGQGLKGLFTDPGRTLANIPKGVGRKVKSVAKGDKGGGTTRREFAVAVGADPETDHPALKKLLDKLALRRGIGKGAVSVGSFALTAGAANVAMVARGASAMRTTAEMNEAVASTPLYKINENIRDELVSLGVAMPLAQRFIEEKSFTTVQRMLFMEQFRPLGRLPGAAVLVETALEQEDRGAALAHIRLVGMFRELHRTDRIAKLARLSNPLAELADGRVIYAVAGDYITPSPALRKDLTALRSKYPDREVILTTQGRVSPPVREMLGTEKIGVLENVETPESSPHADAHSAGSAYKQP